MSSRLRWTTVRTTVLASSLAALLAACGVSGKPDDAPPPPPPPSPPASGGAGPAAPEGGAGGGGGTATTPPAGGGGGTGTPAGGSSGGPTAQGDGGGASGGTAAGGTSAGGATPGGTSAGGTPAGGTTPGGTPAGGTPSGGTATGGTTGGGSSSGGAGTPAPAAPCNGLVPALSQPVDVILEGPDGCIAATTDPAGHVALGVERATPTTGDELVMLPYGADGTPQGAAMPVFATSPFDLDGWFHWTSSGWRGLVRDPGAQFSLHVMTWDARGTPVALTESGVRSISPDGNGGSVALTTDGDPPTAYHLVWIDAGGRVTRSAAIDDDASRTVVDWNTGHVFALVPGSSVRPTKVRWFGTDGAPLTDWTDLHLSKGNGSTMHVLVDGAVVLDGSSLEWARAIPDGGGGADVPAWLAARPRTRLATIRGGRAYAVLPILGADQLEIVTASGQSCGTVKVPVPTVTGGQARLDVGQDGTLLLTSSTSPDATPRRCEFRWWPGLLR
jgi:hypothetical protein